MWFDSAGWGVTPAAAGVRVARGRDGRKWPRACQEFCVWGIP